jgi:hypothetical protein
MHTYRLLVLRQEPRRKAILMFYTWTLSITSLLRKSRLVIYSWWRYVYWILFILTTLQLHLGKYWYKANQTVSTKRERIFESYRLVCFFCRIFLPQIAWDLLRFLCRILVAYVCNLPGLSLPWLYECFWSLVRKLNWMRDVPIQLAIVLIYLPVVANLVIKLEIWQNAQLVL